MNHHPKENGVNGHDAGAPWIPPNKPSKCTWSLKDSGTAKCPHATYRPIHDRKQPLNCILEAVGETPLVRLSRLEKEYGLECEVYAKCEFFNPGGSIKDRIALRMVETAEREGRIKPGTTIIEPTSGNTGVGLAMVCAVKGYRCIIVLPEKMSMEKVNVLKALGAEIIRTPTCARYHSPESHIRVAYKLLAETPNAVILDQQLNPNNPMVHYNTTAEEILEQCGGKADMLVVGAGTGGTITGIARKFKEKCPSCKVVSFDPEGSQLALPAEMNETDVTYYEVEGIGYDFIPTVLDRSVVDKWDKSNDRDSLVMARKLIRLEGLLCGGSSGAAVSIMVKVAKELKKGQKCIVVLPDSIRNYMTKHLMEGWMVERGLLPLKMPEKNWWCNVPVRDMNVSIPVSIRPTTTCEDAVAFMRKLGFDQLAVVDENDILIGMASIGGLTSRFCSGKIKMSDEVSKCLDETYKKIKADDDLGLLSCLLQSNQYVIVTGQKIIYDLIVYQSCNVNVKTKKLRKDASGTGNVTGIVTSDDLLKFISSK